MHVQESDYRQANITDNNKVSQYHSKTKTRWETPLLQVKHRYGDNALHCVTRSDKPSAFAKLSMQVGRCLHQSVE